MDIKDVLPQWTLSHVSTRARAATNRHTYKETEHRQSPPTATGRQADRTLCPNPKTTVPSTPSTSAHRYMLHTLHTQPSPNLTVSTNPSNPSAFQICRLRHSDSPVP